MTPSPLTYITAALAGLLLVAGAIIWQRGARIETLEERAKVERAAHARTIADMKAATEKARADDLAHARAVETRYATIAKEQTDDLTTRLAAARADAARFAARLRAQAAAGGGGGSVSGVSVAAASASGADGAGEAAELDDARACAEAVTKAGAWREWWLRVSRE